MSDDTNIFDIQPDDATHQAETRWRPNSATIQLRTFIYPIAFDALCISASFSSIALFLGRFFTESTWAFVLALVLPLYLLIALNSKVYSVSLLSDPLQSVGRTIKAYLIAVAMMTLASFYLKATELPRLTVALGSVRRKTLLFCSASQRNRRR